VVNGEICGGGRLGEVGKDYGRAERV